MAVVVFPTALLAYSLFALFDWLLPRKRYFLFGVLALLVTLVAGNFTNVLAQYFYEEVFHWDNFRQWIQNMLVLAIIMLSFRVAKRGIISRLNLQRLREESLRMELDLLRAQLNPHFFSIPLITSAVSTKSLRREERKC